jgi:ABC-type taurine transport system substrate-binding protein
MTLISQSRRRFLATLTATGAAGLAAPRSKAQEGRPETTTVRIGKIAGICIAPQYFAEALLRAEGFTDIRYVLVDAGAPAALALARGEIDFTTNFSPPLIIAINAGEPITIVAGEHVGCFELFAREGIRSIPELRGKTVGVQALNSSQYTFLSGMTSYVGLDAAKDIRWVTSSSPKPMELFAEGKIDAFLGLPPEPQELRARKIGRVIFNSSTDRPWSQYFCCMVVGTGTTFARIQSRPSASCARSSRRQTFASPSRSRSRGVLLRRDLPRAMTTPSRRSRRFRTRSGGSTTQRTRSGSIRCGCARPALSRQLPTRSLPTALIGVSSMSSNAS